MNFTYFLTTEEVKQNGMINTNVDIEYVDFALQEAQSVYLREILGDLLYNSLINKVNSDTLTGKYQTLVNDYIKIYLSYKMLSLIVIGVNFKIRNAGVISQYDQGFNTTGMKDTKYIQEQYDSKSEFYANRLTTYLQKNTADFPEYGYSEDNITQPTESQNVTTIYLGGGRKKGCGCNTSTPQATTTTVEWDNIQNRPDFAQVAYSNDYNDLDNKPEIPSVEGYATEQWVQEQGYSTFSGDYNDLQNKPTIPTVPTNVSAFTNDAGYTTETYVDNAIQQVEGEIPTVPTNVSAFTNDAGYLTQHQSLDGYATEQWVSEQGFSTFSGSYNDLADKPTIPTVNDALLTIKQGGVTKGTFTANSNENIEINLEAGGSGSTDWDDIENKPNFATVATSGDYEDLTNKPTIPTVPTNVSAFTNDAGYLTQHQSLAGYATETWVQQQGYSTFSGDYNDLQNKPTIPTVPTNVSAFTNDAGYTTFDGDYNSLTNKPTIPAAQVNSDWNASTGVAQILNKPNLASVATSGNYSDLNGTPSLSTVATSGDYEDLTNKPTIPTVPTNVSAFTNDAGYLTQHQSLQGYATETWVQQQGYSTFSGDYEDLTNKPSIPAPQIQSDWNQTNTSEVDYIKNKPTIPVVPTNVSAFTNDAGYLTQHQSLQGYATETWVQQQGYSTFDGDYNSLNNKPTIPAAQVQSDWNANSGMGEILNKPSMTAETWQFTLSDGSVVTKTVWLQ